MPGRLFHLLVPPYMYFIFYGYLTLLCYLLTSVNQNIQNLDIGFPVKVIGYNEEPERTRGHLTRIESAFFAAFRWAYC